MKTKILLVYGYLIPILTSIVVSALPWLFPWLFGFISYAEIAIYISENIAILFAFLAMIGTLAIPFQNSILNENNPHVLAVLGETTKVRSEFVRASMYQVGFIVFLSSLVLILSTIDNQSIVTGYFELLALLLIAFEIIALISNGIAYGQIREKVITEVAKASLKDSKNQQSLLAPDDSEE